MNWADLIFRLQEAGLSQPQIARRCGCAQSTISDLASGTTKDPRFSIGKALVELASERGTHGDELADQGQKQPQTPAHQARAAINSDYAQEAAHG